MRFRGAIAMVGLWLPVAGTAAPPNEAAPNRPGAAADVTAPIPETPAPVPAAIELDAYDAVREGNHLLRAGNAKDALRLYEHADRLKPDAREIAFAEGLSQYALGNYEQARESFQRVSLGEADALADDAIYSEGASYHAEALGAMDNPQLALSQLENAMQRYQSVLAHRPDHERAKDANYKAAHAWRQIKQMMQQQQQQQQSGDKQKDDEQNQDQQQNRQQQQDENDRQESPQDQQQQQQQQSDQNEQQQSQQQQSQQQQDDQEQQQAQAEQKDSEQQAQPSPQEEDVSREQAERKLREMMQAQHQRQKNRTQRRALVPVRRTEKDW